MAPRDISLPKVSYNFGKNHSVFTKNSSKIRINPFVPKKSRTLFPMSEVPLAWHTVSFQLMFTILHVKKHLQ